MLLSGDLGAGKTAFVRGLAEGLGIDPARRSPARPSRSSRSTAAAGCRLYHVDLYRLKPTEVDDLGLDEMTLAGGVTAIEWPDRLPRAVRGGRRRFISSSATARRARSQ